MASHHDYDHNMTAGLEREPVRSSTLNAVNGAGMVVDPMVGNPYLQSAMQILDQLADMGKALPFIAPAFVLLKIIIDVEKRAQDVDAKCNDLLERINFMLGHLPDVKDLDVSGSAQRVIQRMITALKDAAALISAYRKQGRIVRRLSLNNREKFTTCADAITTCTTDLMLSLQIHQSTKLDILTRAVPVDPEDEAARTFVASHGGLEEVTHSVEAVTQFAREQHLTMDDTVMEQLNTSLSDLMQQNHNRLEDLLKENVGAAVVDGLKGLAAEMNAIEAEQRFQCVQCDKEFRTSTNGPKSCSFHRAGYDSWNKTYPCCSASHPCQFQSHRANHHCDYPYGKFFGRSSGIQNYVDTKETWASVEDNDLETGGTQKAYIYRLLRWKSRGAPTEEPTMLISVGTVWHDTPYFFDTFTAKQLASVSAAVSLTRQTTIFRTSQNESEFAMAEWVVSRRGDIVGVRLTAKSATSASPFIRVCPIDISKCALSGEVVTLSEGGIRSYKPDKAYVLPEMVRICPTVSDEPPRAVRTDFKTRTSPNLRVILKTISDPPLIANDKWKSYEVDHFEGTISVFNAHPAGSLNPITIASVSAAFRLVGDTEYAPASTCKAEGLDFPFTIEPRQTCPLKFQLSVPRPKEDIEAKVDWWNRAFIARFRPIRIKLILEDIEGEECSIVLEYVYKPFRFERQKENDLAFLFFDDPSSNYERAYIHVEKSDREGDVLQIDGNGITAEQLDKAVYRAIKTGESEVDLGIGWERRDGEWEWATWALVDLSCRRVYAFKIMLKEGRLVTKKKYGCLGYIPCSDYGNPINRVRPIHYAIEKARLPDLVPFTEPSYVTDDKVDDYVPEPPKPVAPPVGNGTAVAPGQVVISAELNQRLTSIDSSLSRIATALELLVEKLAAK